MEVELLSISPGDGVEEFLLMPAVSGKSVIIILCILYIAHQYTG